MPIDVSEGGPGAAMVEMAKELEGKQRRLRLLDDYWRGEPPLVMGTESQKSAFYRFQRVARANFAALVVQALCERLAVRSIRTAAPDDENGDVEASRLWRRSNLDEFAPDVHRWMATFSEAYGSVGIDETDGLPVICAEDPRQVVTVVDPVNPRRTTAAFKLIHDAQRQMDLAYLWRVDLDQDLPGEMWVAYRRRKARPASKRAENGLWRPQPIPVSFSPKSFDMAPMKDEVEDWTGPVSHRYASRRVPVRRFGNRDGVGEFELHLDLIDRINHMILQRIVIATLQAFMQRAIEIDAAGDALPTHDPETGEEIDYDDLFSADPGALWRLPRGATIWESKQVDLRPILESVKDDVLHLATVTRTPFSMFTPDAANQSAQGAQLQREGLVFKVEDRQRIVASAWADLVSLAFEFGGDSGRSDPDQIVIDWYPAERYSLQEKAAADASAVSLPAEQKWRLIWGMSPDEIEIAKSQQARDAEVAAKASAFGGLMETLNRQSGDPASA